jgi:hypothetical protein
MTHSLPHADTTYAENDNHELFVCFCLRVLKCVNGNSLADLSFQEFKPCFSDSLIILPMRRRPVLCLIVLSLITVRDTLSPSVTETSDGSNWKERFAAHEFGIERTAAMAMLMTMQPGMNLGIEERVQAASGFRTRRGRSSTCSALTTSA